MTDVIVAERLTKDYGERRVVDSVDLKIPAGCVYGFLGRNGAGKSTFIKMLMGMVKPDVGRAMLLGEDVAELRPAARERIAYLAEGHPLYHWMRVADAARFARGFYRVWRQDFLDAILDHFGISQQAKIGRLSNGQRAQVSLALALAPDPELLILDDPTLGLDTVVRRDFLESMVHLIQRSGRTIFFSSHILGDIERVADRIGILVDGVLRVDCPTEHFKAALRRVVLTFLGSAPDFPPCAGVVNQRRLGGKLELTVVGWNDEHAALAEALGPMSIEVMELSLEDAFIAYTPEVGAAAAEHGVGDRHMLKTLAWKEIRELAPLIVMAALAQAFFVTQAMHRGQPFNLPPFLRTDQESIPFLIGDNSLQFIYLVAGAAAIVAGLWQTLGEAWRGTFLFLLHRPLTREAVVGVKLLVGGLAALLLVVAPVFFYAIWAALPGTHDSPFEWSYTRDAWVMCAELPVIYCGAFLSGLRPGNWFGSRFFPLAAALVTFGECQTIGNLWRDSGWAVGLAVSLAATVIFGWLIFHVARERDFS